MCRNYIVRLAVVFSFLASSVSARTTGIQLRDSIVAPLSVEALPQETKTVVSHKKSDYHFTTRSLVLPGALIATGAACMSMHDFRPVNMAAKEYMAADPGPRKYYYDNYTMFLPVAAVYGLNAAGIKGLHNFKDRSLILLLSTTICNTMVFTTKFATAQTRPDASDNYSFPSGHTAMAFANAEFMRMEYKDVSPWYGAAGYAAAIGTGMLRMYHNKHWLTDVVAGAGVGMLSTRLAYWMYPRLGSLISSKHEHRVQAMVAPMVMDKTYGLTLALHF